MKIQSDNFSCGPIALSNAITALGFQPPPLTKLRTLCRTTRLGTNCVDIIRAAERLGFKLKSTSQRRSKLSTYIIWHKSLGGRGHFVVQTRHGIHNYWNGHKYVRCSQKQINHIYKIFRITHEERQTQY